MTISCDHPRPKLNLPGYTPPRYSWQPPTFLPSSSLADLSRALTEQLRGVYAVLQQVGQRRTVVPLYEDIDARAGQVIVGVADGQVIRLPLGLDGDLGQVGIVLTDVINPVTIVNPDGTTQTLGTVGAYDFVSGLTDTYQTNPGGAVAGGSRDALSVFGRASNTAGVGDDIAAIGRRQVLSTGTAGTSLSFQTLSAIFPGAPIYDVMAYPFNALGDGTGDDLAALNAAIAAANATGGTIYLGPSHRISTGLDAIVASCVVLKGRGMDGGGTVITCTTAPAAIITIGSGSRFCGIEDLRVGTTAASTSGFAVKLESVFHGFVRNVRTFSTGSGFEIDRCNSTVLDNCNVTDLLGPYGFYVHGLAPSSFCHVTSFSGSSAAQQYPLSLNIGRGDWATSTAYALGDVVRANGGLWQCSTAGTSSGSGTGPGSAGLPSALVSTVHTTTVADGSAVWRFAMGAFAGFAHGSFAHTVTYHQCGVLQGNIGMHVFDDAGDEPTFVHAWQFASDHPFERGILVESGNAIWLDQTLVTSVLYGSGIELQADAHDWQLSGGEVYGISQHGIIVAGSNGKICGLTVAGTSSATANTYDGITVSASTTDFVIADCTSGDIPGRSSAARYGIAIAASCNRYTVIGNTCTGNDTGAILNTPGVATTRVVRCNIPEQAYYDAPDGFETFALAAGTQTLTVAETTHTAIITPTGAVVIDQIVHGAGNDGRVLQIIKEGVSSAGSVALRDTNTDADSIWTPNSVDYMLTAYNDAVRLEHDNGSRWRVIAPGRLALRKNSTGSDFTRRRINVIEGTGITLTVADDSTNEETDFTIASSLVGLTDGDKGDITVSSSGTVWTVDTNINKAWTGTHSWDSPGTFTVETAGDTLLYASGGGVHIGAGHEVTNVGNGDVIVNATSGAAITAGLGAAQTGETGGVVALRASGSLIFETNATERLEIENDGAWQLAGVTGTSGQVLTSGGSAAPPSWTTIAALTDGDKGDVTVSASGATWTVDANIAKTWTGVHSFTGASHTINVTGAVNVDADATSRFTTSVGDLMLSTTDTGGVLALESQGGSGGDGSEIRMGNSVQVDADNFFRISTGTGITERLEIESDGAWQLGGDQGDLGSPMLSQGASSPPIWGDRSDVTDATIIASGSSAASTIVTLTIPADTLVVGSTYELYAHCRYVRSGSPATSHSVTMSAEANGSTMGMSLAVTSGTQNSNTSHVIYAGTFTCLTAGGSGTAIATLAIDQNIALDTNPLTMNAGSSGAGTIDTTASNTIRLRVSFSAGVAGASFDCRRAWIKRTA